MSRELVFVHGRAQQGKDPGQLKEAWIDAWKLGLAKSNLAMPIDESAIHFPFYGDTLDALVDGRPPPDVVVMGTGADGRGAGDDRRGAPGGARLARDHGRAGDG